MRHEASRPGAVHEDLHATASFAHLACKTIEACRVRDVCLHNAMTGAGQLLEQRLGDAKIRAKDDHDAATGTREPLADCRPDAACASGDDRNGVSEFGSLVGRNYDGVVRAE